MSMHFVPQWVKQPIKPSGSSAMAPSSAEQTPTALNSTQSHVQKPATSTSTSTSVPFPALSGGSNNESPAAFASRNAAPMSYSRATHTPVSPGFPTDGSYFPTSDGANGGSAAPNPYPFRYSRERILALYDEEKVKGTPIELIELLEANSVLVAPQAKRPVSMRDRSELEKKLLSTSVHPPIVSRRQNQNQNSSNASPANHDANANGNTPRRGAANITRDPTQPNGRGFGGFGRGEGGALGGAVPKPGVIGGGVVPPPGEGKAPGVLGGGFGGVGKRIGRGRGEGTEGPSENARPWRATRTASGNFEGVLGFGGPQTAAPSQPPVDEEHESSEPPMPPVPQSAPIVGGWRERLAAKQGARKEDDAADQSFGNATLQSTGTQKQWRAPVGQIGQGGPTVAVDMPVPEAPSSMSVIASPAATPLPDRDAALELSESLYQTPAPAPAPQQPQVPDVHSVQWFYQDPQGNEHGPFRPAEMQHWHQDSYFDPASLLVRRAHERGFYLLQDLQKATGSLTEPFITAPPIAQPPPGLSNNFPPHPSQFQQMQPPTGQFQDLAIGSPFGADPRNLGHPQAPLPMQPFPQQRPPQAFNDSAFNNQFMPGPGPREDAFQTPGFGGPQGSPWGGMPLQQPLQGRFNGMGAFGSPGIPSPIGAIPPPFPPQNAFSPAIGQQLARGPEFFSPSVGVGSIPTSPWGVPQPPAQQRPQQMPPQPMQDQQPGMQQQGAPMAWQQQQQQPSPMQPLSQPEQPFEQQPSYFPPAQNAQEVTPATSTRSLEPAYQQAQYQPEEQSVEEEAPLEQQEPGSVVDEEPEKPTTGPPPSAWAPVPAVSRKSSVAESAPTPAQAIATPEAPAKLPPAPASLPAKPAVTQPTPEPETVSSAQATPDKAGLPAKPAPWASVKEERDTKSPVGPSLREIQQAEAKAASARKQAIAEARANNAIPSPAISASDETITSMSWGLPSQGSKGHQVQPPAVASPSTPVWGGGEAAAPKKTLKQIQEEEEKRRVKMAAAKAQAQGTPAGPATPAAAAKRGYADLAATSTPPPAAGWQTVGAGGKGVPGSTASPSVSRVASSAAKPAASTPVKSAVPAPITRVVKPDDSTPSVDFIRWTKQSLNGLNVNIDEFIQMLLSFPIDPPASERAGQLEIIQDSVYANSSTLDGRRFAQEFYTRRKADSKRSSQPNANGATPAKATSLADVLKTQPKPQSNDTGFKVVKAKGKKKN